jgi:hypothetical protein
MKPPLAEMEPQCCCPNRGCATAAIDFVGSPDWVLYVRPDARILRARMNCTICKREWDVYCQPEWFRVTRLVTKEKP